MMSFPSIPPLDFNLFSFRDVAIDDLPGLKDESFEDAWLAWKRSSKLLKSLPPETSFGVAGTRAQWEDILQKNVPQDNFFDFLKDCFKAYHLSYEGQNKGLFTGYYEPCLKASKTSSQEFCYPVYGRPPELLVIEDLSLFNPALAGYRIAGTVHEKTLRPYFARRALSEGILEGRNLEIAWVADKVDLYFMHIQGSGKLDFGDHWARVSYDGTNGYSYTSIGKYILQQGFLKPEQATMSGIKKWFCENPERRDEILYQNESFVFFKDLGAQEGPIGRQGAVLTPKRSLAVDTRVIAMGMPLWLSADSPCSSENPLQRFMVAQDVGGAIKGPIRGDYYWGTGDHAGDLAGKMKSEGELYFLIPKTIEIKGFSNG